MNFKTLSISSALFVMSSPSPWDGMSDAVKNEHQLSNVMATRLPFLVFIAFAVFSVPGGLLAARIGK